MGQIDIHNYEAYLLDFSEGNLTDELQMELELFLIQHPELDINLSDLALVSIEIESFSFSNKSNLKKTESDLISEEQFIAYIEHQLPTNEKIELEKSCSINPSLAKELALYQKTIAVADTTIIYQNKNELKRKPKLIWFDFSITQYTAAACVLFLIGLFILWPKSETINDSGIASDSNNDQNTNIKNENPSVAIKEQAANSSSVKENSISHKLNHTRPNVLLATTVTSVNTQNTSTKKDSIVDSVIAQNPTNTPKRNICCCKFYLAKSRRG